MKKIFNLHNIGLVLIVAILSIFSVVRVNATVTWDSNKNTITVNRSVTNVVNPVTNTFTYTVTADANNPAGATGAPTTGSVAMTNQAVSSNTASKSTTIDFSSMTFAHPGTYIYNIAETASSDASTYPVDSTNTYTATVFVENILDANDVPTGNYKATLLLKKATSKVETADFTSSASSSAFGNIKLSKTVTGNASDLTDYFEYTVTINGTTDTYSVSGLTSSVTYNGTAKSNPTTITGGTATKMYLKSGDQAIIGVTNNINSIPTTATYTIVETTTAPTGYTPSYKINSGSAVSDSTITAQAVTSGDNNVAYTNNKSATTPTGIILTIIPYLIIIIVAIAGTLIYVNIRDQKTKTKKK